MTKCLVVDDDPRILHYVATYLQREGLKVVSESSGEAALDYLETNQVDIAIVDIMMNGMDGFELCETLKADYEDIPVIMLTARDALSDKERAFLTGTDDYVTKPFEVEELMFRIRAVLRRYQKNADTEIQLGNLTLNQAYLEIAVDQKRMNLPNKEFTLLFSTETSFLQRIVNREDLGL